MPTFDVVSETDMHEVHNALDQASREIGTRYDFKGTDASLTLDAEVITLNAQTEFQLEQMQDILYQKMAKRGVDLVGLQADKPVPTGQRVQQRIRIRRGIDAETGRKLVKLMKDSKLKLQASIVGDQVRVSGKKRDDLQDAIALLRAADLGLPLQFRNFRD